MSANTISHTGTIKSINDQHLIVKIISQAACASCQAKGACSSSDSSEKEVEVIQNADSFFIGEEVLVVGTLSQGYKALLFAYLIPLALLVINLLILNTYTKNEAFSALGALLSLAPYYFILYLNREKIQNSFNFAIRKLPNLR